MNSIQPFVESLSGSYDWSFPVDGSFQLNFPLVAAWNGIPSESITYIGALALNLLGAALILLLGWLVANWVAGITRGLLRKTDVDERLASFISGSTRSQLNVENIIATVVGWIIKILAIVAALNVLNLNTVSEPLNNFLNQVFAFLPRLGSAAALLGVAWLLALIVKGLVIQSAESFELDSKLVSASTEGGISPSETLGNALYWFVFLFFLPIILGVLGLEGPLAPVQVLLTSLLSAVPRIIKALAIGVVGWFVAQVVRNLVANFLAATGVDQWGSRVGIRPDRTGQSLSSLAGLLAYIFILIPAVVAALQALEIAAISAPATAMLGQFMSAIPLIFTAAAILTVAYFVGKLLGELSSSLLAGFGFDGIMQTLGFQTAAAPSDAELGAGPISRANSPSQIVGTVVLVGTMLLAAVAAVDVLNLPALKVIATGLLQIAGQVLVGVVIFSIGVYLANLAAGLIRSSGFKESNFLATAAQVAIWAFAGAMALRQIGIGADIVNLAFGLLLGAIAVALAIAFGLGGRDVAAEQLRDWLNTWKR
jgi:hypothetical protein